MPASENGRLHLFRFEWGAERVLASIPFEAVRGAVRGLGETEIFIPFGFPNHQPRGQFVVAIAVLKQGL